MLCMLMHAMGHSDHAQAPRPEGLFEILRRRYAVGEITAEQFEEMKRVLGLAGTGEAGARPTEATGHRH